MALTTIVAGLDGCMPFSKSVKLAKVTNMSDNEDRDSQMDTIPNNIPELELVKVEPPKEITYEEAFGYDPDSINWDLIWQSR